MILIYGVGSCQEVDSNLIRKEDNEQTATLRIINSVLKNKLILKKK